MAATLLETVTETFPNAGHVHPYGADSALIEWLDGYLVVTPSEEAAGGYVLGLYVREGWEDLGEPVVDYVDLPADVARVAAFLDYLTEPPEAVDWLAWAAQRLSDIGADADQYERWETDL